MAKARVCAVPDCGKPYHSHGYCARHAYHFRAHGNPLGGRRGASPGEPLRWIMERASYQGDDCISWPFEIGRYGYGTVKHKGKKRVASRVMCEEAHGPAPEPTMDAAHSCGNGQQGCMNPNHLSWKSRELNVADAMEHGTWVHGERVHQSKLTADKVREIRRLSAAVDQYELASSFGVNQAQISRILRGKAWRSVV